MPCHPLTYDNLASVAATHDPTKPIYVLNLWKYRSTALYAPEHAHLADLPCTGREATVRYRAALQPLLPPGAEVFFASNVLTEVPAPEDEKWNTAMIVRYQTLAGFRKMAECKTYKEEVEPHRLAGLEDFRLLMLEKLEF